MLHKHKQNHVRSISFHKLTGQELPRIKSSGLQQLQIEKPKSFSTGRSQIATLLKRYQSQDNSNKQNSKYSFLTLMNAGKSQNNFGKMQQSVLKFVHQEINYSKVHMQKKKKKKMYSMDKGDDEEFMKTFYRKANKLKDQIFQEQFHQTFSLKTMPNICYDSQFTTQRTGSCLTMLNNKLYLFGGAIRKKFSPIAYKNTNEDILLHSYDQERWVRQPILSELGPDRLNLIHHTLVSIGRKYLVLAGGMIGDTQQTLSKFNRTILCYNVETKRILEYPWALHIRSHSSISFDNTMVLFGGIDEDGLVRSQLYIATFNFCNSNFVSKIVRTETNEARAHHQIISTLGEEKSFRINLRENNGIFVFGGESLNGQMDGNLRILRAFSVFDLEKKGIRKFEIVPTLGQGPCPRKNHSMNLVSSKSCIVIIGGQDVNTNILDDIWVISLLHLRWFRITTTPNLSELFGGICRHASTASSSTIIIMGGYHTKDPGCQSLWKLNLCLDKRPEKKSQEKRISGLSALTKFSSFHSNKGSSNELELEDVIEEALD